MEIHIWRRINYYLFSRVNFPLVSFGRKCRSYCSRVHKTKSRSLTCFCLSMGYEKDIFGIFPYDFEVSQKMKSTHPPSRRISSNEVGFHRQRRFHPPVRVDLVEKPTSRNLSVFLMETAGVEPATENLFTQLSPGADRLLSFLHVTPAIRLHVQ